MKIEEMPRSLRTNSGIEEIFELLSPVTKPLLRAMLWSLIGAGTLLIVLIVLCAVVYTIGYVLSMGAMGLVIILLCFILMHLPKEIK